MPSYPYRVYPGRLADAMDNKKSFFKRLIVGICAVSLIGANLVGCLAVPTMPDMSGSMEAVSNSISRVANSIGGDALKGSLSGHQLADARRAQDIMNQAASGAYRVGYSTPEYKERLARFHAAREVIASGNGRYTQSQFLELSESLTALLNYVDTIETIRENPQVGNRTLPAYQSSYTLAPGAKATFTMHGLCLAQEHPAPSRQEPLQLVPISQVWPGPLGTVYQNLMQNYVAKEHRPAKRSMFELDQNAVNLQTAVWALQKVKDGDYTGQAIRDLSPEQQKMLFDAGLEQALQGSGGMQAITSMARSIATDFATSRLNNMLAGANASSNGLLGNALASLPVNPVEIMDNPRVLQDGDLLLNALNGWMENHTDRPASTFAGAETGMTLLADGVAARANATSTLRAEVEIVNASSRPFVFTPRDYALNARSATQPVGPSEWQNTRMGRGVELVSSPMDDTIRQALEDDLRLLAMEKSLESFTRADGAALNQISRMFTSRGVQRLVGAMPVVGNIISLGKMISGKNLDGTEMNGWDYAAEAVGLIPVAGNIAKILGPTAVTMAGELARRFPDRRYIEAALDVAGSEVVEATVPRWLEQQYDTIARRAISGLPETSAQVRQAGIRI